MASLGQLAAGVAHEINNPVGFVRSNLETLEQYLADIISFVTALEAQDPSVKSLTDEFDIAFLLEDTQDIITTNLGGLDRISEIVQGLKSFSHQGDSEASRIDLVPVVQAALSVANNELKYKHTVVNQLPATPLAIMGKAGQLQQVFINLFVNASQAMADGGTLRITADISEGDIVIAVTDTGSGMSQETQQQLFNPFYTTKAVGEGTGLGLSISYSIVEAHYGKIWVKSTLGKGTTFFVSFPQAEPESNVPAAAE
jgi:signal transduction histidine kinase